jgi:hypothetical protein
MPRAKDIEDRVEGAEKLGIDDPGVGPDRKERRS